MSIHVKCFEALTKDVLTAGSGLTNNTDLSPSDGDEESHSMLTQATRSEQGNYIYLCQGYRLRNTEGRKIFMNPFTFLNNKMLTNHNDIIILEGGKLVQIARFQVSCDSKNKILKLLMPFCLFTVASLGGGGRPSLCKVDGTSPLGNWREFPPGNLKKENLF